MVETISIAAALRTNFPAIGDHVDDHRLLHQRANAIPHIADYGGNLVDAIADNVTALLLGVGEYMVNSDLVLSGIHLHGAGVDATTIKFTGSGTLFTLAGNVAIENMSINGVGAGNMGIVLGTAQSSTQAYLHNIVIRNFRTTNIRSVNGQIVQMRRVVSKTGGAGMIFDGGTAFSINDCAFIENNGPGCVVNQLFASIFHGSYFGSNAAEGMIVGGAVHTLRMYANWFEANGAEYQFYVDDTAPGPRGLKMQDTYFIAPSAKHMRLANVRGRIVDNYYISPNDVIDADGNNVLQVHGDDGSRWNVAGGSVVFNP